MPYATLDRAVSDVVNETLEHFNANHADTILLIARHGAGTPDASDAEGVSVDAEGIEFEVVEHGRKRRTRAAFASPVSTADEVSMAVLTLLGEARAAAGDAYPATSFERELAQQGAIPTHHAEVLAVRDLTGNLREIVVGGPQLADYVSVGGDQFVYVLVPRAGEELAPGYTMAEWMAADPETRPFGAYYTVRTWNRDTNEMVLWAVLHGHHDGVGGWFAHCRPGDRLAMWGPREGYWTEGLYAPAIDGEPHHHLFVADESGFCAVAALLDGLPEGDSATVLAETVDADHTIEFPGARTNVVWHYRGTDEPGTGEGLYELMTTFVGRLGDDKITTAFGAGESRQITRIRKFLRHQIGLPASHVSMTGYWRRSST